MKFFSHKQRQFILNLPISLRDVFISFTFIFFIIFFPSIARAGIVSFIGDLVSGEAEANEEEGDFKERSHNMALLEAAVNVDPQSKNIKSLPPVSGNALIPQIGIGGTLAEIDSHITTEINTYVVRKGDTLSEIAAIFGVSINTIMWANDINKATSLQEGQMLVILPISGVRHTIAKGDTISTIAKRYKSDIDEILAYNDINLSSVLTPGGVLIIPDGEYSPQNSLPGKTSKLAGGGPSYLGYYIRPIKGGTKTQGIHGFNAVDLAGISGTPIYASAGGKVIVSVTGGWNGGYGNYIVISHSNGTQTLYAHNSKNIVSVGDEVVQGENIALMGSTGKSTGPHVHFEIRGAKNPF